jgi:hypothetical protein
MSLQAGEGSKGKTPQDNSSDLSVELTSALPPVPQGHRLARKRKRKAQELESTGYEPTCLL